MYGSQSVTSFSGSTANGCSVRTANRSVSANECMHAGFETGIRANSRPPERTM